MGVNAGKALGKAKLWTIRHKSDLAFAGGGILIITGTVMLVRGTLKSAEVINSHKERVENAKTKSEKKKQIKITVKTVAKNMGPGIAVEVAGGALMTFAHVSNKKTIAKLGATLAGTTATLANIKKRVIDDAGESKWREYETGVKAKDVVDVETGEVTEVQEADLSDESVKEEAEKIIFCKIFDSANSINYEKIAWVNKKHIEDVLAWAQNKLERQGYLFWNEVLEDLGMNITKVGQTAGWIYDDQTLDHISFGLEDKINERFMAGKEPVAILRFNCRADILTGMLCETY